MIRTHAKREQILQSRWGGPMLVKEAKSSIAFIVEDLGNAQLQTVHVQRMLSYPVKSAAQPASKELIEQAMHNDTTNHFVHEILNIRKQKGELQVLIEWPRLNVDAERTWEPLNQFREDIPAVPENFFYTAGKIDFKKTPSAYIFNEYRTMEHS